MCAGMAEASAISANLSKRNRTKGAKKQVAWRLVVQSQKSTSLVTNQRRIDMPNVSHDTTGVTPLQSASAQPDDWEQEGLPRLPRGWEQQAHELGAFVRSREVRSP